MYGGATATGYIVFTDLRQLIFTEELKHMKFNFTDKDSYLAWRQEWRDNYRQLSSQIRQMKRRRKDFLRTYEKVQTEQGPVRRLVAKIPNPESGPFWELPSLRVAAAYQMELLTEAKALSWQMRQARLAEEAA